MGSCHTSHSRVSERLFCIHPISQCNMLQPCMLTPYLLLSVVILTDNQQNTDANSKNSDNPDQANKVALIRYSQQSVSRRIIILCRTSLIRVQERNYADESGFTA